MPRKSSGSKRQFAISKEVLADWKALCAGKKTFDRFHFSTLFMGMYAEGPIPKRDIQALRTILRHFPNGSKLLERLLAWMEPVDLSPEQIIQFVKRDLAQKRKILVRRESASDLVKLIDARRLAFTKSAEAFALVQRSDSQMRFHDAISEYIAWHVGRASDPKVECLEEAFYGVGFDLDLQNCLTAGLLGLSISFENYYELSRAGANYALAEDHVEIIYHRLHM